MSESNELDRPALNWMIDECRKANKNEEEDEEEEEEEEEDKEEGEGGREIERERERERGGEVKKLTSMQCLYNFFPSISEAGEPVRSFTGAAYN